jgi:hypothetical protein
MSREKSEETKEAIDYFFFKLSCIKDTDAFYKEISSIAHIFLKEADGIRLPAYWAEAQDECLQADRMAELELLLWVAVKSALWEFFESETIVRAEWVANGGE